MGEGNSAAFARSRRHDRRRRGSDKDLSNRLPVVPELARAVLFEVAAEHGWEGVLLLLTTYRLRPAHIAHVKLCADGLVVPGCSRPLPVSEKDRAILSEFLGRKTRLSTPGSIHTTLGRLRKLVIERLDDEGDPETQQQCAWTRYLGLGVRDLRRIAAEELAEEAHYAEAAYRVLMRDETADPDDTLRFLTARARRVLGDAMAEIERSLDGRGPSGSKAHNAAHL